MRYRIGETPPEAGAGLEAGSFIGIAVLSIVIGIGFVIAGIRSRHYWMAIWGSGLVIASIAYILYVLLSPGTLPPS